MQHLTAEQRKAFDKSLIESGGLISKGRMVCFNEEYDRNASPEERGKPRFVSCLCFKCSGWSGWMGA